MSLIRDIQNSIVLPKVDVGSLLLKTRLLAARLEIDNLEEWVQHEIEGYPADAEVPDYRQIGIAYFGDFSGPFGSGIKNAPIPPYLIEKHAGIAWNSMTLRQSLASIESMIESNSNRGTITTSQADLILLLHGHVYEGYSCNSVQGVIGVPALIEIQNAVKGKILKLTIELEKRIPSSLEANVMESKKNESENITKANYITNNVVYGDNFAINNSGNGARISVRNTKFQKKELQQEFVRAGVPSGDAKEISNIIASEKPGPSGIGTGATEWLAKNLSKAISGTWKIGADVLTALVIAAAKAFYGL